MIQSFFYSIFHSLVKKNHNLFPIFLWFFCKKYFCLQFESSILHFMRLICTPRQKLNCNFVAPHDLFTRFFNGLSGIVDLVEYTQ